MELITSFQPFPSLFSISLNYTIMHPALHAGKQDTSKSPTSNIQNSASQAAAYATSPILVHFLHLSYSHPLSDKGTTLALLWILAKDPQLSLPLLVSQHPD